jgi:hypothetical protein
MRRGVACGAVGVLVSSLVVAVAGPALAVSSNQHVCAKKRERGVVVTTYCGSGSATITYGGKTYRASGGTCFNSYSHGGVPAGWYAFIGKHTDVTGFDPVMPRHAFLHVTTDVREPGTYKAGRPVTVTVQLPGVGEAPIENRVWRLPGKTIRVTGRVTLSNVRGGVGPIPRRGTINAVALFWDPRTEPGSLPAAKPLTASWRC